MDNRDNSSFDFGKNWKKYSDNALDSSRFEEAFTSLVQLAGEGEIAGKSFLDIGCGSGLFALSASKAGACRVTGIDVSLNSIETSLQNQQRFLPHSEINFQHKSIFDQDIKELGKHQVVYSWGVLHHTGSMWNAFDVTMELVEDRGMLIVAIYNKHWSSPLWKIIKRFYNISPKIVQKIMICIFCGIIAIAKFLVTGKNPFARKKRGMTFYYDVIDWVGGYPYEYASKNEIVNYVEAKGFKLQKFVKASVPTGCNEYVFIK
jgi:2-polyprenyl-6-hydroxyphenyl methylase/3-demethylubiquinone-9 3-methyltransferase